MMNNSSCHPCAWCDITKDALHKKGNQCTIMMNNSSCDPCAWCDIIKDALHNKKGNQCMISLEMKYWKQRNLEMLSTLYTLRQQR